MNKTPNLDEFIASMEYIRHHDPTQERIAELAEAIKADLETMGG